MPVVTGGGGWDYGVIAPPFKDKVSECLQPLSTLFWPTQKLSISQHGSEILN